MISRRTFWLIGSRPLNGSSRITISGRCRTVAMNWSFCCIPFDSSSTFESRHSASSNRSSQWSISGRLCDGDTPFSSARNVRSRLTVIRRYTPRSSGR